MAEMCEEYESKLKSLIEEGDVAAVERYITEKNITPEAYYEHFFAIRVCGRLGPVGTAAKCGNVKVMKRLLELGFSVDEVQRVIAPCRPIHMACEGGSVATVKMLVEEYGVDINHRNNLFVQSATCVAAEHGHIEVLQYFLDRGFSVNHRSGAHTVPALLAAAANNQDEVCKFLLSKGAQVDLGDAHNNTPLMYSAMNRSLDSAQVLLDAGADVNMANNEGETAFYCATENNYLDMLKLLYSHGADPDLVDRFHVSPLHRAVTGNHYDTVFYLVNELNVVLSTQANYEVLGTGESAFTWALQQRNYDIARLLIRAGYDPSRELSQYKEYEDCGEEDETDSSDDSEFILPRRRKRLKVAEDSPELRNLKQLVARPRSLIALCALTVRRVLGRRLPVDLERLPLPEVLKNQIIACGVVKQQD